MDIKELVVAKSMGLSKEGIRGKRYLYVGEDFVVVAMDCKEYFKEFPEEKRHFDLISRHDKE